MPDVRLPAGVFDQSCGLFRSVGYLVVEMAGLMIAAQLAQGSVVELKQNVTQLVRFRIPRSETLSVNLAQRANEGVAVLVADFAILVAMAIVEARLVHAALPCARGRQHLPVEAEWQ
jgi:hypothetical protein